MDFEVFWKNFSYLCKKLGNGETGTVKSEPSALLMATELPTKSCILGDLPNSGESYCRVHNLNNLELNAAVGQYHTIN